MKLEARRVEAFLDSPGACRAVLLFVAVAPIVFVNARNQRAMREGR